MKASGWAPVPGIQHPAKAYRQQALESVCKKFASLGIIYLTFPHQYFIIKIFKHINKIKQFYSEQILPLVIFSHIYFLPTHQLTFFFMLFKVSCRHEYASPEVFSTSLTRIQFMIILPFLMR